MPDPSEALELVQRDVERGVGEWLSPDDVDGAGFRVLEPFDREPNPIAAPDGGPVAIPWAWVGRHTGDVMGYLPTGQIVEVRGVTLVRDTEKGPAFSRFIDWVGALGDMGVTVFTRPVTDEGPPPDLEGTSKPARRRRPSP